MLDGQDQRRKFAAQYQRKTKNLIFSYFNHPQVTIISFSVYSILSTVCRSQQFYVAFDKKWGKSVARVAAEQDVAGCTWSFMVGGRAFIQHCLEFAVAVGLIVAGRPIELL